MNEEYKRILDEDVRLVNEAISRCGELSYSDTPGELVIKAESYSLLAGGKRIRAALCVEFNRLFGGRIADCCYDVAACLEYIHAFSLIHDDMPEMDNDPVRRGKPSTHVKFGQNIALLAGDGLSLLPFEIIPKLCENRSIDPEKAVRLMGTLASAAGSRGMIMGQALDIHSEGIDCDLDYLIKMSELKTGCLLKASAVFGAILAGASKKEEEAASRYAAGVGLAFQIVDDVLDVIGDEKLLGKPIGSDKRRNKNTFAAILGIDGAMKLAKKYTDQAVSAIASYEGSELLCQLAQDLMSRNK